jgi:hypothetical protein
VTQTIPLISDETFARVQRSEMAYMEKVRRASAFLAVPDIRGAAQVPILYDRETLAEAQRMCEVALNEFKQSVTDEEYNAYRAICEDAAP